MANIIHSKGNSFIATDFVEVIQLKLRKCFHHFYLSYLTILFNYFSYLLFNIPD